MHHPPAHLREMDHRVEEILRGPGGVAFVLRGHVHRSDPVVHTVPGGGMAELGAGAVFDRDGGACRRSCTLTEVDPGRGEARVHLFGYSREGRGFWARDSLAHEGAAGGIWS